MPLKVLMKYLAVIPLLFAGAVCHAGGLEKSADAKAPNAQDSIMIEKDKLADIKELIDQMMMELRFRGLEDEHELVQEALETGRWINKKLRGVD